MEQRPLVIIHGWSDHASSFHRLGRLLGEAMALSPQLINMGDYISMDDAVTFADLSAALLHAWKKCELPLEPGAVDVLVHSTGGLVIRDWMTRYFKSHNVPIKHFNVHSLLPFL